MKHMFYLIPADGRKSFYNKAAAVRSGEGWCLLSYGTPVLYFDGVQSVTRLWSGYSVTTTRHVNAFMAVFGFGQYRGKSWWCSLPVNIPVKLV